MNSTENGLAGFKKLISFLFGIGKGTLLLSHLFAQREYRGVVLVGNPHNP